jgi:peptidoglycan/xylan/chitin deacetylase (PgdA/CDA1 family)
MSLLYQGGFNVISFSESVKLLQQGNPIPPKTVVITFDDGFRNNYVYAYQILMKYGFSGIFFLVSDFIDSEEPFPWMKQHGEPREEIKDALPMKWRQARKMLHGGMEFGSHSLDHRKLDGLHGEELYYEINDSKKTIERQLNQRVIAFAFPYGISGAVGILEVLRECGYEAALGIEEGRMGLSDNVFNMKRIAVVEDDGIFWFKLKVSGSYDLPLHTKTCLKKALKKYD